MGKVLEKRGKVNNCEKSIESFEKHGKGLKKRRESSKNRVLKCFCKKREGVFEKVLKRKERVLEREEFSKGEYTFRRRGKVLRRDGS